MTSRKKTIPLNIDLFDDLVKNGYYYVDKTLLVKHLLDSGSKVTLYARPRRFGKSLNLSMLDCFFNIDGRGKGLFEGTAIMRAGENYVAEMGKYPVVKLTFKEMKQPNYAAAEVNFRTIIRSAWDVHSYLRNSPKLEPQHQRQVDDILSDRTATEQLANSILALTEFLHRHHGTPAVLLFDEYDVPLEAGYTGGFYQEALALMRSLMSSSCKDNPHLRLAVHTGCLRIARESIYTGFNNPTINTLLSTSASDCFGFTEEEVQAMFEYYGMEHLMPTVRDWYDGYRFGDTEIYNPWSLLHFLHEAFSDPVRAVQPYWMNTSGNNLLVDLIRTSTAARATRNAVEKLLDGDTVVCKVNENVNYDSLKTEPDALWNLLLFTGYLKPVEPPTLLGNDNRVPLRLVNREVEYILREKVEVWYQELYHSGQQMPLVGALEAGRPENAQAMLDDLLLQTVSYHDSQENFHHGFLAGLLAGAPGRICVSNRESGDGRSDLSLQAKDYSAAFVIEVKEAADGTPEALELAAENALEQAVNLRYDIPLRLRGFRQVHVYGIACHAKRCRILMRPEP